MSARLNLPLKPGLEAFRLLFKGQETWVCGGVACRHGS